MSAIATIQLRNFIQPVRLTPWDEVTAALRRSPGLESELIIQPVQLEAAIDRALDALWPKCFRQEQWRIDLFEYTPLILLPWAPTDVVFASFLETDSVNHGYVIPHVQWAIDGPRWRWMQDESTWPGGLVSSPYKVSFALEAIGKPARRADEPLGCSVPLEFLRPIVEAELLSTLEIARGVDPSKAITDGDFLKESRLTRLRTMRRPGVLARTDEVLGVNNVWWYTWGDTHVTFDQLG